MCSAEEFTKNVTKLSGPSIASICYVVRVYNKASNSCKTYKPTSTHCSYFTRNKSKPDSVLLRKLTHCR